MDVPDVNILLYAQFSKYPQHEDCRAWLETAIEEGVPLGLSSVALNGFVRIGLQPKAFDPPHTLEVLTRTIDGLLGAPLVRRIEPGPRHWERMRDLLRAIRGGHNDVTDAYLAALAIENGATLVSADRGFRRFPGLRVLDPVAKRR